MNRFKKLELEPIKLDFEYERSEFFGDVYEFSCFDFEIYTKKFDIIANLFLTHYEGLSSKSYFEICNIRVNTDSFNLKLSEEEHMTIHDKIHDAIIVASIQY